MHYQEANFALNCLFNLIKLQFEPQEYRMTAPLLIFRTFITVEIHKRGVMSEIIHVM